MKQPSNSHEKSDIPMPKSEDLTPIHFGTLSICMLIQV